MRTLLAGLLVTGLLALTVLATPATAVHQGRDWKEGVFQPSTGGGR